MKYDYSFRVSRSIYACYIVIISKRKQMFLAVFQESLQKIILGKIGEDRGSLTVAQINKIVGLEQLLEALLLDIRA